jgi:cell division protein FtsZ
MHQAQMREEARQRELEQRATETQAQAEPERPQPRPEPAQAEPERPQLRPEPAQAEPAPRQSPPQPRVDPREALEGAGLQMVETRADRVPPTAPEAEVVSLGRPRRERSRPALTEDAPLVQIETKN